MKFVHIADMHFDTSFTQLSNSENLGNLRRLEQKKVFKKVIEYIKNNNIEYFFIAGDLYEHNYIRESTIEYINNLFKEIPNTKIFITPGNHDPYLKNSFYNKFRWNDNVHIFGPNISVVNCGDVNIYGFGFDDFYYTNSELDSFELNNKSAINILITHATLNGTNNVEKQYNAIQKYTLDRIGFDYVALGHIHKTNYDEKCNIQKSLNSFSYKEGDSKIIYPGSTVSMGFDELGKHGMIVGEIQKNLEPKIQFIKIDEKEFIEKEIDVTNILSKEELIEKINEELILDNQFAKIILIGKRNFEIEIYELYKIIQNPRIIKIKNNTKINFNLEQISNQNTLKGLFAKEIYQKMNLDNVSEDEKEIMEKAVEIVFEALK